MANEILEFQFLDFRIVSSAFSSKMVNDFDPSKAPEITVNFTMRHDFDAESKNMRLFLKVDMEGADLPFNLSIEGGSLFVFSNPIENNDYLLQIAEINCAAIAFPYMREAVSDMIRRGGFPLLLLPPQNFAQMFKTNHPDAVLI